MVPKTPMGKRQMTNDEILLKLNAICSSLSSYSAAFTKTGNTIAGKDLMDMANEIDRIKVELWKLLGAENADPGDKQ